MEVVQGVHQIKIPLPNSNMPLDHVNVYLVEGSQGNLLIDAGWNTPEAFSALEEGLRDSGFDFKDISQIIITHLHADHYGMAGKIKELSGAKVALSKIEADMLDSRYVNLDALLQQLTHFLHSNGVPQDELPGFARASLPARKFVIPVSPDIILEGGGKISIGSSEFEVLLTPGHSPGHICLYEPERKLLFSGDHVLPEITPNVGFHPQSGENPLGGFLKSLQYLSKLEVNFVFPGHGHVFSGLGLRIEELIRHHEKRELDIMNVLRAEKKSAYQIAAEIPWVPDAEDATFQDLSVFDKRLAVMETLAHIQLWVTEGELQRIKENDIILYQAAG